MGSCILCGSADAEIVFTGPDRMMGLPGTYSVIRCVRCGLARTSPQIPVEERAKYFAPEEGAGAGLEERFRLYHARLARRIDRLVKSDGKRRVLDIGCGDGTFLELMRDRGWDAVGIELGEDACRVAREERGLNVLTGDLSSCRFEEGSFDAVVMSHVLEHLGEPLDALQTVNRMLKPGGVLMLSLPNYRSPEARLFGRNWLSWALPPHLYHFEKGSIRLALQKTGFSVDRITYLPFFYIVQNLRYALNSNPAAQADQSSRGSRLVADGYPRDPGPGWISRAIKDRVKTLIFKTILTFSDLTGRFIPGEIMEIEAKKDSNLQPPTSNF